MSANTEDGQENSEVTNSLLHSLCNTLSDRSSIDWLIGWLNHWIMALSKNELFMTRNWCQYFCKFYQNPRKFAAHPMSIVAKRLDWSWHLARGWALVQATCARWGPSSPPPKRGQSAQFSAHFYCGQTAKCIKMPLGMEVGLSPGDFVLDENPAPSQIRGGTPNFRPMSIVAKRLDGSRCHLVHR